MAEIIEDNEAAHVHPPVQHRPIDSLILSGPSGREVALYREIIPQTAMRAEVLGKGITASKPAPPTFSNWVSMPAGTAASRTFAKPSAR
ncbi:hypothetical protein ACFSUD_18130 [Sulfitobacter aestuarii]|uniref:Uncharacterized protein n=1 Tax=Sulfitobacter aestuarii TaxID=2161676 RepID=A0ABW5U6P6_9RHOB